jgi:tetratricopeptide (TPR) repeat protein
MHHKFISLIIAVLLFFSWVSPLFPASVASEYLCEFGISFYRLGRYDDALAEFKKVLLIDPKNQTAKQYIDAIFRNEAAKSPPETVIGKAPARPLNRDEAMTETLKKLSYQGPRASPSLVSGKTEFQQEREAKKQLQIGKVNISGEVQMSAGIAPGDFYWKRANYDLNERNWRMLSGAALDRYFNTYDSRVFQSFDLELDTANKDGFNFHTDITVDPWSFTGKGPKTTVTTGFGDTVDVELKYWSNTGYTVNETLYSKIDGNTFSIPEVKVRNGQADQFTARGAFADPIADTLTLPATKIERQFQPIRELWLDYANDSTRFRLFPIAYQDQALTSDDPLAITNHHQWWEDSLWLRRYQPGIFNSGAVPVDFTKGWWDNSLPFLSRDSSGTYLTALRGMSFELKPQEGASLSTTVATPKDLWQDYGDIDNVISATRFKQSLGERLLIGSTFTSRHGFKTDSGMRLDSENYVGGFDLGYEAIDGFKTQAEVLTSRSRYDLSNSDYKSESRGNAYYLSFISRYPQKSLKDLKYGYEEIRRGKEETSLSKTKLYAAHIDKGFDSSLSSFRNTRDDTFWSRHISFRKPFAYYSNGLKGSGINFDEVWATRVGDGIDAGRNVIGLRTELQYEDALDNIFDLRNVHATNGKFIENVARDEVTIMLTDKLTAKGLGIYHKLHDTVKGIDPFVFDSLTGRYLINDSVTDGKDVSLRTGSLGLEYAFLEWLSLNGVYERTNDYYFAYGSFPNGVLNSSKLGYTYTADGKVYRVENPWLYDQGLFPQAPYPFYNIFKTGLRLTPLVNKLEIYLDYTRNEYEIAGQNSDNMNHIGCEIAFSPTKKLGIVFKYTYSRWKDLDRLRSGITEPAGHHNFFSEFRYMPSQDDEFIIQYGEGNTSPIGGISFDPYGGSLSTIDTQHIIRTYYRKKF